MKAIRVSKPGGPEALEYADAELPTPGEGEARVRIEAIGVNFIDVYHRTGLYPLATPFTPGMEAAGVVEAVGPGVSEVAEGDRVVYIHPGSYADAAIVPAAKLVPVPDAVDSRTAAAAMLQGLTAQYLVTSTYPLNGGEKVLVQAAAGGVGAILVQMAKQRGAFVFGTASTTKLDIVREAGADVVIDYTTTDFEPEVMRRTDGVGLEVVFDSVGQATFDRSLNCVKTRGMLAMFGQSSGAVEPFDILRLSRKSIYLTRPSIGHFLQTRDELLWRTGELFDAIASGDLTIRIDREVPLADAGEAHTVLEGRQTAGKVLLIP